MKRMIQLTAALALTVAVGACGGDSSRNEDTYAAPGTAAGTAGTTGNASVDAEFVQEQMTMGQAEIEMGRLAQQKASHADVKEFGSMMVRDHQTSGDELKQVASQTPVQNASPDHEEHQEFLEELRGLSGREFDRKYMERMVEDHEKGIRQLEQKAEGDANPQVKQWATKTLPTMRQHLERAKSIKDSLDRGTSND